MSSFRFTEGNVRKAVSSLLSQMITNKQSSIDITSLSGSIRLPGSGHIGSTNAVVSLTSDSKLVIDRRDKKNEEPYDFPLDDIAIQWIKNNKIPVHQKL